MKRDLDDLGLLEGYHLEYREAPLSQLEAAIRLSE